MGFIQQLGLATTQRLAILTFGVWLGLHADTLRAAESAGFGQQVQSHLKRCQLMLNAYRDMLWGSDLRFTGYHGEMWTVETFDRTFQEEGVYAPMVRTYATAKGIAVDKAVAELAFFKEMPEDLVALAIIAHMSEQLGYRSPFVATSRRVDAAGAHGPFQWNSFSILDMNGPAEKAPAVLFSSSHNENAFDVKQAVKGEGRKAFDLLYRLGMVVRGKMYKPIGIDSNARLEVMTPEDCRNDPAPENQRLFQLYEWLEKHDWLSQMTAPFLYRNGDRPNRELAIRNFLEMVNAAGMSLDNLGHELKKMLRLEQEVVVMLQVPVEKIERAVFYNKDMKPVRTIVRGQLADKP